MTTTDAPAAVAADVVARAGALAPVIRARAEEIERGRRVPADLLAELVSAGCLRVSMPASHGGSGADLPTALRMFEVLAEADASVAWVVMIGSGTWCDLAGLPRASFDAVYADPTALVAGAINPSGTIEPVDDGFEVVGRWAFASGCEHATWMFANCVEGGAGGEPQLRAAMLRRDEVVIEDTWHVTGLRGTGSHHFHVDRVRVPATRTLLPLADERCLDEPMVHIPTPSVIAMSISAAAVGIARTALADVTELATTKVPAFAGSTLAANPWFRTELATADTELRAARSVLVEIAEEAWSTATDDAVFTLEHVARMRATATWVTARAASVVDAAYVAGGGRSIQADYPLQRRWRDVHAITQHFLVKPDILTSAGAVLAGQQPHEMLF